MVKEVRMIQVWLGKAKSGKTQKLFDYINHRVDIGKAHHTMLIVPEQYTLEAEKQFIEKNVRQGVLGLEILSFKRLAHKILAEVGGFDHVPIDDIGKLILLRKIFAEKEAVLNLYQRAYNKPGFLKRFYELIQELKQSMIGIEELKMILSKTRPSELLHHKLHDLLIVLDAYETSKDKVLIDDEDLYALLIEKIKKSKKFKNFEICVDGFDSFTTQEYAIIEAIAETCCGIQITICADGVDADNHFNHTHNTLSKIKGIAERLGCLLEVKNTSFSPPPSQIHHVAENMMNYPYEQKNHHSEMTKCFGAVSRQSEVEHCAAEIVDLIRSKGFGWKDIAVVTPTLDAYDPIIQRVFTVYEIPFFLDVKKDLMANPLVHFVLSLCKTLLEVRDTQFLLRMMKTGLLDMSFEETAQLEIYMKQNGILTRHLFHDFKKESKEGASLEKLNQLREILVLVLSPLKKIAGTKKTTVKQYVEVIFNTLMDQKIYIKIQSYVEGFNQANHFDEAQMFAQVWNETIRIFDQMVALMGDETMSLKAFVSLLETGYESVNVGRLPLDANRVLIGSMDRSRAHPIRALFVLGVNDGFLPEAGSDQQLIGDAEKESIVEQGFSFLADNTMFLEKEAFNVYMTFTRPADYLFISYARSDAEGNALRPSYLINKLPKIDQSIKIKQEQQVEDPECLPKMISNKSATFRHLSINVRKAFDGYPLSKKWLEVYKWYAKNEAEKVETLLKALTHSNLAEKLNHKVISALYAPPIKTSVSRLEEYVQCPFKYFVSSGLKPNVIKGYKIEYPDVGILFHSALELFGKHIFDNNLNWRTLPEEESHRVMDEIVDQMVDSDLYRSRYSYQFMVHKLKRVSKRAIDTLTHHLNRGDFEPSAFELMFSEGMMGVPPIVIELPNGEKMLLRGVIDRVDILNLGGHSFVKIIDYKSGTKTWSLSDVYHGLQMQLLVYLKACIGNPAYFKASHLYPAGAFYFKIDDPLIESTQQLKEDVMAQLNSELKLDGLCLDSLEVLNSMDRSLSETGQSEVVKVKFKVSGEFTKDSKIVDLDHFNDLMFWVENKIIQIGTSLMEGNLDIHPCKNGTFTSCQYCQYGAICQFDTKFKGNVYNNLSALSDEEVLKAVESEGGTSRVDK